MLFFKRDVPFRKHNMNILKNVWACRVSAFMSKIVGVVGNKN